MAGINVNAMVDYALSFQGIPYVYGGNGVPAQCYKWSSGSSCSVHKKGTKYTGYDCSGFVTKVMSAYGISMPRTTSAMQSWKPGANGQVLGTGVTRKRGDIILYNGHVTIAISSTQMVHAPSCGKNICIANTYTKGMTKIFRFYDTGGSSSGNGGSGDSGGGAGSSEVNNNVLCSPSSNVTQMRNWASGKKATQTFINNAQYFYNYGKKVGVNPTLAYAQYAWETGYGSYKGQVKESQCNTCGLKNSNNQGFATFSSWNQGIEAHIDHLALYAGASGYPRSGSPDPKHFTSLLGKYRTIDAMGLSWAGGEQAYANRLKNFMKEIQVSAGADAGGGSGGGTAPTPTGKKVFLDPGHGGSDSGAVGNGLKEKDINLSVGLKIKKLLEERGVAVKMSRETDKSVNLSDRPSQANSWGADCFLSIHSNSASTNTAQGVETFHYSSSDGLAQAVQGQIIADTSLWHKNRGVKRNNFYVIRESKMMSALVELAFINNTSDSQLLRDKQDGFATACAKGIIQYLGCSWDNIGTPGGDSSNDGWEQGAVGEYDPATKYIGQAYNLKGDSLNIRSGAGVGNPVIDKIWEGAKVNVYEVLSNGWLRVKIENGKIGYCSGNYIKRIADPPGKPQPKYIYKVVVPVDDIHKREEELSKIKALGYSSACLESRTL